MTVAGARKRHILLVEDEQRLRVLLHRELEARGYDVVSAYDGLDALSTLSVERPVDVLVVDMNLPGSSGDAVADQVRKRRPDLPVVFISGYPIPPELVAPGKRAVGLAKPFTPRELVASIEALTEE